jgi:hypothetical protein
LISTADIYAARMARIDPPRNEPFVELEIDCAASGQVVCGQLLDYGTQTVTVYESQVKELERLLETKTKADFDIVDARLAAQKAAWVAEKKTDADFTGSFESAFRELYFRDVLPIRSLKRITPQAQPASKKQ